MTPVDDLSVHAARVHKRLRPVAVGEEKYGYTVAALAAAICAPSDPLNDVVRGGANHEPFEPAVNPAKAPPWVLRWLGAIVGAPVGAPRAGQTLDEWAEEARQIIVERPHWQRGTPLYIRRTVLATLDPSATLTDVTLIERTTGPWDDTLVISASRCPDQAFTTKVAMSEKPAMRRWAIVYEDLPIIDAAGLAKTIDSVGAAVTIDDALVGDIA